MVDPKEILPHSEPFIFIDKILETTVDDDKTKIKALVSFSGDEFFFQGHFKGNPIVPGVLIIEALTQCAGLLNYFNEDNEIDKKRGGMLVGVESFKFIKSVSPPVEISLLAEEVARFGDLVKATVSAEANGEIISKGKVTLALDPQ